MIVDSTALPEQVVADMVAQLRLCRAARRCGVLCLCGRHRRPYARDAGRRNASCRSGNTADVRVVYRPRDRCRAQANLGAM